MTLGIYSQFQKPTHNVMMAALTMEAGYEEYRPDTTKKQQKSKMEPAINAVLFRFAVPGSHSIFVIDSTNPPYALARGFKPNRYTVKKEAINNSDTFAGDNASSGNARRKTSEMIR